MKKIITLATILAVSVPAMANSVSSVAQAKRAYDNARFSISGYIVSQIDEDEFTFKDSTGTIRIDVEDGAWRGLNVGPKDRVRISGKVDVDDDTGRRTLDVYQISR